VAGVRPKGLAPRERTVLMRYASESIALMLKLGQTETEGDVEVRMFTPSSRKAGCLQLGSRAQPR
jgi:hypothetical protein